MVLVQPHGNYARMVRVGSAILCCYEFRGNCWVRRSTDDGRTWTEGVQAAEYSAGNAANPELLVCRNNHVLLFFNGRPDDDTSPFTIQISRSTDGGLTFTQDKTAVYTAGHTEGCYEPAAVQRADGSVRLFFANEFPHRDGSQEISSTISTDEGRHWSAATAATYRAKCRDGMPVPTILNDGQLVISIEDNGRAKTLQPAVIDLHDTDTVIDGKSSRRWAAVQSLPEKTYAGAPYLRQLSTGITVLSCQVKQGSEPNHAVVYQGDSTAKNFTGPTEPFGSDSQSQWSSLFVKNADTITLVSSARINGHYGVWAIDGHVTVSSKKE